MDMCGLIRKGRHEVDKGKARRKTVRATRAIFLCFYWNSLHCFLSSILMEALPSGYDFTKAKLAYNSVSLATMFKGTFVFC